MPKKVRSKSIQTEAISTTTEINNEWNIFSSKYSHWPLTHSGFSVSWRSNKNNIVIGILDSFVFFFSLWNQPLVYTVANKTNGQ